MKRIHEKSAAKRGWRGERDMIRVRILAAFNNVFFFSINSQVTYVVYMLFTRRMACIAGGFGGVFALKSVT